MVILGVDPGTIITGIGVIESVNGSLRLLACDAIRNKSSDPMPLRLKRIHENLQQVIDRYRPNEFAIETAFYGKNAQSALKLGHARGVAILAAVSREIPTSEYSPREVKKSVVGTGGASKEQVRYMVKSILHLKSISTTLDVTDAIAVAICHAHRSATGPRGYRSWKAYVASHPDKVSRPSRRSGR
jgi:crossover junction endodeoxyribonuclease RuvC